MVVCRKSFTLCLSVSALRRLFLSEPVTSRHQRRGAECGRMQRLGLMLRRQELRAGAAGRALPIGRARYESNRKNHRWTLSDARFNIERMHRRAELGRGAHRRKSPASADVLMSLRRVDERPYTITGRLSDHRQRRQRGRWQSPKRPSRAKVPCLQSPLAGRGDQSALEQSCAFGFPRYLA